MWEKPNIVLYSDRLSQPGRTVSILLKASEIPYEEKEVSFIKGENRDPSFIDMQPLGTVPFMKDGDLSIPECIAQIRYVSDKYGSWLYPKDPEARVNIDAALSWYHLNIRLPVVGSVFYRIIGSFVPKSLEYYLVPCNVPLDTPLSKDTPEHIKEYSWKLLERSLDTIEHTWLKPFVGGNRLTVADILWASELEQLNMLPHTNLTEILKKYPKIQSWLTLVKSRLSPHWEDVHEGVRKMTR
jgi:glutathione S-transferase